MIENKAAVDRVDEIASVDGVDVLLVGSNDLAVKLGVPGDFCNDEFRDALSSVSAAWKKHGKIMSLAGIYDQPDIHEWAIYTLGVRFLLDQQDLGLIAGGAIKCLASLIEAEIACRHRRVEWKRASLVTR